jgi:preprotein translocase subunit SecG
VHFLTSLLNVLVVITSLFLICLVLIQRGKGGGLAGAFGGTGGSSAFGTKAGDVFTRITMITALAWIVMLMALVILMNNGASAWEDDSSATSPKSALPGVPDSSPLPGGDIGKSPLPSPADLPPPDPTPPSNPTSPIRPPVSSTGPSAPLPVSPAPGALPPIEKPGVPPAGPQRKP